MVLPLIPDGDAKITDFNSAFHSSNWFTVGQEIGLKIKPLDPSGNQRFGGRFVNNDPFELGAASHIDVPGAR